MPGPTTNGVHELHIEGLSKKVIATDIHASLPDEFYHSPAIFQLERRAIFSRRWFLVSHRARYHNVGDFVQYEMAGFNFVVVKNKEEKIVGFHNICRHRAFPIVKDTTGNARIFSCKYHGWSYDLNGKLAKAPRFTPNSVPAFDPTTIRLFPVHVHTDRNGFVYANLDASAEPEISWDEQYGALDQQDVLKHAGVDWEEVEYDFTWTKEGQFNWKLMQDNYNECYHCLTAHPDVARTTALDTYYVEPASEHNYISHFSEPKASILATSAFDMTRFAGRSATHVFPTGHFSPNPGTGFMHLMRSIPLSATTTRQEYDVYRLKTPHATTEAHERMTKFYQKVVDEDFALCENVQKNIGRGIFESGPLHPFHEEGVLAFQRMVLMILREQVKKEDEARKQIWAARPDSGLASMGVRMDTIPRANSGQNDVQAQSLCEMMLGCETNSKALDW